MDKDALQQHRRERLKAAAIKAGSNVALGKLLGYLDGAFIGQMLREERPVSEDFVMKLEAKTGYRGWFSQTADGEMEQAIGSSGEPVQIAANVAHEGLVLSYAGGPQLFGMAPVTAIARIGENSFFDEEPFSGTTGGWVPSFGANPTYAIQIKGDGLAPAFENGVYVLVEPGAEAQPGERVVINFKDGRKAIRKLLFVKQGDLHVTGVSGVALQSIDAKDVASVHPIFGMVEASRWMSTQPVQQTIANERPPPVADEEQLIERTPPKSRYVKSKNLGATAKTQKLGKKRGAA